MLEARDHGRGFFIQWVQLPVAVAWEAMGEKNGAASLEERRARLERYREETCGPHGDDIGCLLLSEPFFRALVLRGSEAITMVVSAAGETITPTPKHRMASVSLPLPNSRGQG